MQVFDDTEFDPDIVVVRLDEVGGAKFWTPPLLATEIRSPSTAIVDRNTKLAAYETFGVASYWIFDPNPDRAGLTVFELHDGSYAQIAQATDTNSLRIEHPFPVDLIPAELTVRPRR